MLTELIDKIDCNPELMMCLAEQLGALTDSLGSDAKTKAQNCAHLLRPLEIIAGSDDSVVQNKAVTSLNKVSNVLSDEIVHNEYVDLIKRLKKGDFFSMRIAACQLYAQIYERLNEEKRAVVRKKFAKLVKDDTPMVRWGSAQAMAVITLHLEK
jgi:serine/threonine-protein phosphatase 2A regulatory subunit A